MTTRRRWALACAGVLMLASTTTAAGFPAERETVVHSESRISLPPLHQIPVAPPLASPVLKAEVTHKAKAVAGRRTLVKPKKVSKPSPKPTRQHKTAPRKKPEAVTRIAGYVYCGSAVAAAQRCIDQGKLTLYYPAGVKTLAGHNYMGWSWMDDLPVGRKVVIASGGLKGSYRVYAHGWAKRGSQGGTFPKAGLGASVALQTCTSNGTGFSFLRRT